MLSKKTINPALLLALVTGFFPGLAFAEDVLSGADTAWIMSSTALVLFMTLPGLALFYGGLVRSKNVLSILMQCFSIFNNYSLVLYIGMYHNLHNQRMFYGYIRSLLSYHSLLHQLYILQDKQCILFRSLQPLAGLILQLTA